MGVLGVTGLVCRALLESGGACPLPCLVATRESFLKLNARTPRCASFAQQLYHFNPSTAVHHHQQPVPLPTALLSLPYVPYHLGFFVTCRASIQRNS